jgi:hypothetical protein
MPKVLRTRLFAIATAIGAVILLLGLLVKASGALDRWLGASELSTGSAAPQASAVALPDLRNIPAFWFDSSALVRPDALTIGDASGGTTTTIPLPTDISTDIVFSRLNGEAMVYAVSAEDHATLHLVDLRSGSDRAFDVGRGEDISDVFVNPRLHAIYYASSRRLPPTKQNPMGWGGASLGVWEVRWDGGQPTRLLPPEVVPAGQPGLRNGTPPTTLYLDPDGAKLVAAVCQNAGSCQVRAVDTSSTAVTELTNPRVSGVLGVVHDAVVVDVTSVGGEGIWLLSLHNGALVQVVQFPGFVSSFAILSRDDAVAWEEDPTGPARGRIHLTDLQSGADRVIFAGDRMYSPSEPTRMAVPPGWLLLQPGPCPPPPDRTEVLLNLSTGRIVPTGRVDVAESCND